MRRVLIVSTRDDLHIEDAERIKRELEARTGLETVVVTAANVNVVEVET